jgi:cysteine desulfurase/selenocysteine lyase
VAAHEAALLARAEDALARIPGLRLLGAPKRRASLLSFTLEGVHAHDLGTLLDLEGIAVRTGHHCAMPLHARLGVSASARASFAAYTSVEEIDALARALRRIAESWR